ncbi:MAG: DUF4426 domain-containing protein [Proteobacteria bacterium]|nr:DUF4426 domain-containing protein [Pseudomonadota bacterium]
MRFWLALALLAPLTANAEQVQVFGDWKVHYSAFPSTFLKPPIAALYSIKRSRDVGAINITLLDVDDKPANASVSGHATNLLGQALGLSFRKITEGSAIYYIATLRYTDQELLRFDLKVTPENSPPLTVRFNQTLYWDE